MAINYAPMLGTKGIADNCSYCHKPVSYPAIHWYGEDAEEDETDLIFHPRCAEKFAALILQDVQALGATAEAGQSKDWASVH